MIYSTVDQTMYFFVCFAVSFDWCFVVYLLPTLSRSVRTFVHRLLWLQRVGDLMGCCLTLFVLLAADPMLRGGALLILFV